MKKITFFLVFALSIILLSPQGFAWGTVGGEAANDFYMKIGEIQGEAKHRNHRGWLNVVSYDHQKAGLNRRLEIMRLHVLKDRAAPALAAAFREKKVFPSATLDDVSSPATYLRYELKNVQVTSYQVNSAGNNIGLTFNFEEIKVTYTETDLAGKKKDTVKYEWSLGPKIL